MACCGKAKKPSAIRVAKNAARAAGRAAVRIVSTEKLFVSKEQRSERLDVCNQCEELENGRCSECGCFVVAKSWLTTEDCPTGKWKALANEE